MNPIDPDDMTEEQKRYASTPVAAYTIAALMLLGLILSLLSNSLGVD